MLNLEMSELDPTTHHIGPTSPGLPEATDRTVSGPENSGPAWSSVNLGRKETELTVVGSRNLPLSSPASAAERPPTLPPGGGELPTIERSVVYRAGKKRMLGMQGKPISIRIPKKPDR